jgi:hypothetical protein
MKSQVMIYLINEGSLAQWTRVAIKKLLNYIWVSFMIGIQFVQRAVSMKSKCMHSYKYRENDPDVLEKLLGGHPSPMGQGPFIYKIDHDLALHTVFRHSSDQDCVEWDPVEKVGCVVKYNLIPIENMKVQGPAMPMQCHSAL